MICSSVSETTHLKIIHFNPIDIAKFSKRKLMYDLKFELTKENYYTSRSVLIFKTEIKLHMVT